MERDAGMRTGPRAAGASSRGGRRRGAWSCWSRGRRRPTRTSRSRPSTTAAGAYAVLEVSVGHGCDGLVDDRRSPSRCLPEINSVTPTRNALWEVEKDDRDPRPARGRRPRQRDRRARRLRDLHRADAPLPDGYRDAFELSVQLPEDEGDTLVFPTVQTCEEGESAWIEVPADGQDAEELELPAPSFVITAADETGHDGTATEETSSRARRQGDDAGDDAGDVERRRRLDDRGPRSGRARRRSRWRPRSCGSAAARDPPATAARLAGALLARPSPPSCCSASPGPRAAHATLVGTDPAQGEVLEEAPEQVVLTFDEAVRGVPDACRSSTRRVVPSRRRRRSAGPSSRWSLTSRSATGTPWSSGASSPRTATPSAGR